MRKGLTLFLFLSILISVIFITGCSLFEQKDKTTDADGNWQLIAINGQTNDAGGNSIASYQAIIKLKEGSGSTYVNGTKYGKGFSYTCGNKMIILKDSSDDGFPEDVYDYKLTGNQMTWSYAANELYRFVKSASSPGGGSSYNLSIVTNLPSAISDYTNGVMDMAAFMLVVGNAGIDIPADHIVCELIYVTNVPGLNFSQATNCQLAAAGSIDGPLAHGAITNIIAFNDISTFGTTGTNYFYGITLISNTNTAAIETEDFSDNIVQFNSAPVIKWP
jgi:hypothetical protein